MRIVNSLSGIALFTFLSSIAFSTIAQPMSPRALKSSPYQREVVKTAGIFDVIDDVLDTTDDVLDIREQETRRGEEREARERAAEERQQLIEIERIRQERLFEEQRAASERQRVELEERRAATEGQSGSVAGSESRAGRTIHADNSPARCQVTDSSGSVSNCSSVEVVQKENSLIFVFSFDGEQPVAFQALAEPIKENDDGTITSHPFGFIAYKGEIVEELGGCVLNLPERAYFNPSVRCVSRGTIEADYTGSAE